MGRMRAVGVALLIAAGTVGGIAAQEATPAPFPVAPDPAECRVEPRLLADVVAVVATPVSGGDSPTPFVPPPGEPVDEETAAAIEATLRELFACTNAGDFLRVYALFTDDFVRDFFVGTPITPEVEAFLSAPPQPLPGDQRRVIVRLGEARMLPDGRVGVPIVLDEPDDPRIEEPDYAILVRAGDGWLVDEIHEDVEPAATPTAG